jgi:hypothetical protein
LNAVSNGTEVAKMKKPRHGADQQPRNIQRRTSSSRKKVLSGHEKALVFPGPRDPYRNGTGKRLGHRDSLNFFNAFFSANVAVKS